jgi:aerobic carbon-monoxide dehydrogenase large subunit
MMDVKSDPANFRFIGKPIVRKEDARLTTGHGRFSDDFSLEGQAYAVMVRSPHPHARIRGVEAARARVMPGVLGVFTGADCRTDGLT